MDLRFSRVLALALLALSACSTKKEECGSGQIICPTGCVDPLTDAANCGTCMNACSGDATCAGGTCVCRNSAEVFCDGRCVPRSTFEQDPQNCGGCGIRCGFGTCVAGTCQCQGGTRCDGQTPRCADTANDNANCGGCGLVCSRTGAACASGICACAPATPNDCGTFCTNWATDRANCGVNETACGHACTIANEICANGGCACPVDFPTLCTGTTSSACVNTQTDRLNCGGCGLTCARTGSICAGGGCACPSNLPDTCGTGAGACVSLATDERNCGACGSACPTGATCANRVCNCPPTLPDLCTGPSRCVDTATDERNCGACGRACPSTATCLDGACECPAATPVQCGSKCCAGGCCGDSCQIAHDNGLGQTYFDCNPLGTYGLQAAQAAARAWNPNGSPPGFSLACASQACLGWQSTTQCAVWCYGPSGDPLRGRASVVDSLVCLCPTAGTPNWN